MKTVLLSLLLFPLLANAAPSKNETVQPYPSIWPVLEGMSASCMEVEGTYIDPNQRRWKKEQYPVSQLGEKSGASYQGIWNVVGLSPREVQPDALQAMPRAFTIALNEDQTVSVKYQIGDTEVSSRTFAREAWTCGPEGLTLTVHQKEGPAVDKIPFHGKTVVRATLYRVNEHLYVKSENRSKVWLAHVVPQSSLFVDWQRFIEVRQRPTSSIKPESVLRVNNAKKAFNENYLPARGSKAFAQAPDGSWGWAVDRASPQVAAEDAIAACSKHVKPHNKPCKIVHMDDWWVAQD